MFVNKKDLYQAIKEDELAILLEDSPNGDDDLIDVIEGVYHEMSSYLRGRYDTDLVFIDIFIWSPDSTYDTDLIVTIDAPIHDDSGVAYSAGSLVKDADGTVFKSEQDGNTEDLDNVAWTEVGLFGKYYISTIDNNGNDPDDSGWVELPEDPRNRAIKRIFVDLVLYELHTRIKPRQIPEHRVQKRDDGIKFLKDAANPRNNIYIDLPLIEHEENTGNDISWGSGSKFNHSY